ncbi:TPA: hypothetical protein I7693_22040 [Vibrio vulnificus]|nr:hypothetical protein [Vibrio vulnificus]HAS8210278.1 hypothetical protein [Vibrio vulnificus]HAS8331324.1 hypothetical protein [Vibrio vulnificus]
MGSVVTAQCGSFCSACLHPLTQRYTSNLEYRIFSICPS